MIAGLDWINPVLLREYQQVVRSRMFAWVGVLWLLAQLLISLIYISLLEPTEAGLSLTGPGGQYFAWVIGGLTVVFLLVLPVSTFNRVVRDRKEATLELLTISRISPLQVVFGFLLVAFAQVGLFVLMSFPFVVFAYLFRGLELSTVLWSVYFLVLAALVANAAGLTVASFCRTPRITAVVRVLGGAGILFMGLPIGWTLIMAFLFLGRRSGFPVGLPAEIPWLIVGLVTLGAALAVGICVVISRSNLLFEAANRTTLPRLSVTAIFLIAGAVINGFSWFGASREEELVYGFDIISFLLLLAYSLWILNESNQISPRMREGLPASRLSRRLAFPYLPGRGSAFVYVILNAVLLTGLAFAGYFGCKVKFTDSEFIRAELLKLYCLFPLGCALLVHHLMQRTRFRRVIFVAWFLLVVCVIMWAPLLWGARPFANDNAFETFILGSLTTDRSLIWRAFFAPLIGILCAWPVIRENWRNLR
ncbi:MAG: hypothetical protein PCFJNLEI_03122 [Verrucomicrobiae bacterium]|nr:hypothetical protein [Verrucomicrobiae bacterium]